MPFSESRRRGLLGVNPSLFSCFPWATVVNTFCSVALPTPGTSYLVGAVDTATCWAQLRA